VHGNPVDSKQGVTTQEIVMSQVIQQDVLTRLFVEKGIFSKEEFLEMVRVVNKEMKKAKSREIF